MERDAPALDGPPSAVELRHVTKRFGAFEAVRDVSLRVARGESFSLVGPSGCGKTTLLNLIAGFLEPDEGEVILSDAKATASRLADRAAVMVFQNYALFPHLTVFENVAFGLRVRKLPRATIEEKVAAMLHFVGLSGRDAAYPRQLSGGQQQRVALARALVVEPPVLLLDEPLSNLDARLRDQVRWELREILQQLDITSIFVTHDIHEAFTLSDRLAVMSTGQVVQVGRAWDIYERPVNQFVAHFVGACNVLPGNVRKTEDGISSIALPSGDLVAARADQGGVLGQAVEIYIRPERIALLPPGERPGPGASAVRGKVLRSVYLGSDVDYLVEVGGASLRVRTRADAEPPAEVRAEVLVTWDPGAAYARTRASGEKPEAL
jgi:ABC-type Fe3+/spermidine/putrescine transport system ATPase subunit